MVRLFLASLLAGSCGCQYALAQPGQTAAQVRACTVDATMQNVLNATAGVLSTGAGVEGAVATQETGTTAKGLATSVPITAGVGAAALLVGQFFASAYNADGCSPKLAGAPPVPVVTAPTVAP